MLSLDNPEVQNIQKINDDETNHVQKDQIIHNHNDTLFLFLNCTMRVISTSDVEYTWTDVSLDFFIWVAIIFLT